MVWARGERGSAGGGTVWAVSGVVWQEVCGCGLEVGVCDLGRRWECVMWAGGWSV